MDFIVFDFENEDTNKEFLIRRDDVTLGYLRFQTRRLFKLSEKQKFALSYEIIKHKDDSASPTNRHYYWWRPKLRPDKLLVHDKQLAKIRRGKRKDHMNTEVKITVHTAPELVQKYYDENASPLQTKRTQENAFKERQPKIKSRSTHREKLKGTHSSLKKSEIIESFKSPTRVIKIKADNTYNYRLPPFIIETFWKTILNSEENVRLLNKLYVNLESNPKSTYNILDYVNWLDDIVRKIEVELGIQDRDIRVFQSPDNEICTCSPRNFTEWDSIFSSSLNRRIDAKIRIESSVQTEDLLPPKPIQEKEAKIELGTNTFKPFRLTI